MGENLEKIVLSYAPEYWQTGVGNIVQLRTHFPEYGVIFTEVSQAIQSYNASIKTIKRCQNVHDFGQFLVREQHLLHLNPSKTYYRARRYIKVSRLHLEEALKFNLDYRRCGMTCLSFLKKITNVNMGEIVLVVQVITSDLNSLQLEPERCSDYFIDYIVEF